MQNLQTFVEPETLNDGRWRSGNRNQKKKQTNKQNKTKQNKTKQKQKHGFSAAASLPLSIIP